MANILITGARAPVALDWARNLNRFGHQVYVADSLKYPLSRNTAAIIDYLVLPEPRTDLASYTDDLQKHCITLSIDYLLPTCEEVFYLSYIKPVLSQYCTILCPDFDLISQVHSKKTFLEMAQGLGINVPETQVKMGSELKSQPQDLSDSVIKKEFCRFGTDVKVAPTASYIAKLHDDVKYLLQQKVSDPDSVELCSYGIAHNGKLLAHSLYEPTYRVKQSSGIYFKNYVSQKIVDFIQAFVAKYEYSGQLGFDFIINNEQIYVLECNPRATSGLHLLTSQDLFHCLTGTQEQCLIPEGQPAMVKAAMLLIAFPHAAMSGQYRQWKVDYQKAQDVIVAKDDNPFWLFQFKSIGELIVKALSRKISVRAASTMDIEWDGEKMEKKPE